MTTYIAIASAKGGVGKTTTAVNLACALGQFGREAVLVDGNYLKPNVGLQLGITNLKKHLHHSLKGEGNIFESVYLHPSGVKVIPGSIVYEEIEETHAHTLQDIMLQLKDRVEIVILDSPSGFGKELENVIASSDKAILVTTSELTSITDTLKTKRYCEEKGCEVMGVVVTHISDKEYEADARSIQTIFDKPVIAEIPFDESIKEAVSKKHPVVYANLTSPATIAYKKLAAALIGEKYEPDVNKANIFEYVLQKLGLR